MKLIPVKEAVGQVLCHDMTQIIPGEIKGPRFRKGHIVTAEDIPVLLSMGKENLYVFELEPGMLHENEGAERLCRLCEGSGMSRSEIKEGKIELFAERDGLLQVDRVRLNAVNAAGDLMIATRRGNTPVKRGDRLCGMRVIPLVIPEAQLVKAEAAAGEKPLLRLLPYRMKTSAVVTTGSEVFHGRIQDRFTPVLVEKLRTYGIEVIAHQIVDDEKPHIVEAIETVRAKSPDLILCTGGMSVDPDDNTPGAIVASGAEVITYGAPVLPGAMFLLGYYADGTPICGLPGCVMYAKTTVFDLTLPRLAAGVRMSKQDFVEMGEGGLCLGCTPCRFPACPFG